MDFLICYEHVVREIENNTLIKYELEKRGYSCKIIHFDDIDYCLHAGKDKAKVVVVPWLRYTENVSRYLPLARKPYKLVNLQWEQVYSARSVKIGLTATSGQALNAYHMCWGENSRNRLIEAGVPEDHVVTVGAIQMDYGHPLFQNYYLSRETIAAEYGLDASKKWNLLISSFAYATYPEDALRAMEQKWNMSMAETVMLHKQSQSLTLDWIEKLLQTSQCEFIYRPHPSERVDPRLNKLSAEYPQFHVISERSVKQWAKVCDKVNLWISTSNAELLSMGVDYAIVRPVEIPAEREVESMRNEEFITDCDTFIRYNSTYTAADPAAISDKLKRIDYFYSYDSNYPAYKRTADYLEQVLKSETGQHYPFSVKQRLQKCINGIKLFILSVIMRKCWIRGNTEILRYLPFKPIIRENIDKAIQKRQSKEQTEQAMLNYLKKQDALSSDRTER